MKRSLSASLLSGAFWLVAIGSAGAHGAADDAAFRDLYRELVEINTTLSSGSCTEAAEAMGKRLEAAGFPAGDVHLVVPPEWPAQGNLVAIYPGTAEIPPLLLLAHIDVVEAKREDWERDPFTLIEENGYFYGRGVADDKAMAAIFTDALIRMRQEGYRPQRTRPDLRGGNSEHLQRRQVPDSEPPRADRRGVCTKRGGRGQAGWRS